MRALRLERLAVRTALHIVRQWRAPCSQAAGLSGVRFVSRQHAVERPVDSVCAQLGRGRFDHGVETLLEPPSPLPERQLFGQRQAAAAGAVSKGWLRSPRLPRLGDRRRLQTPRRRGSRQGRVPRRLRGPTAPWQPPSGS